MSEPVHAVNPDDLVDIHVQLDNQPPGSLSQILKLAAHLTAPLYEFVILDDGDLLLTTTSSFTPPLATSLSQRGYECYPSSHD